MKIRKIKFENHQVLGNLELDFTDGNGEAYDTIILAGENGTGKSMILNSIFELPTFKPKEVGNEKRVYELELTESETVKFKEFLRLYKNTIVEEIENSTLIVDFDFSKHNWEQTNLVFNGKEQVSGDYLNTVEMFQIFKTLFSDVDINFTPNEINTITSRSLDKVQASEKSNSNLATEISQLLIDIQAQDSMEFSVWAENNIGAPIEADRINVRIKRFSKAFEYMFPSKKYKNIETISGRKEVQFEENGRIMSLKSLSSGEKQVVFRGSFLLKNKQSTEGALILIDEPELSMHPLWQMKILAYYKKLFTNDNNYQTSQIIIATHSPFIIHNTTRNNDKVIVLKKDQVGQIFVAKNPTFYTWTEEETIQEAFNVSHLLRANTITVFVEGETDEKYFKKAMEIFDISSTEIDIKWIGRNNKSGSAEHSGNKGLDQAKSYYHAHPEMITGKIILLYDIDTNKEEEIFDKLEVKRMTKNESNLFIIKGIENLLSITGDDLEGFYKEFKSDDGYGGGTVVTKLDKVKLCEYLCSDKDKESQKVIFFNLKLEIERILMPTAIPAEKFN